MKKKSTGRKMMLRKFIKRLLKWSVLTSLVTFSIGWWIVPLFFDIPDEATASPEESQIILDRDGTPLHHATREDFVRHRHIPLADIPEPLVQATLAAEDKRFWDHGGIDFLATSRSIKDAIDNGHFVSGASTVSQQVIKLRSPKAPRTIRTKIREAFQARHLEMTQDKSSILESYFNHLEYGNRNQGPVLAASHYFKKPLDQLSLAECALLAGLPQAPTRHNPRNNPEGAIARRNWILDRMAEVYELPADQITRAKNEPLNLAPATQQYATPEIAELFQGRSDTTIQTTISKPLQDEVKAIVQRELQKLSAQNVNNAAVVIIDNATGEIITLLGSPNFESTLGGQFNAALIPRSPGSALKPFTYLLGFQHRGLHPATIIPDIPTFYAGERGPEEIVNYDRKHHGPVTISHALGNSLNIPAVRVLNQAGGPAKLLTLLKQFGFTSLGDNASTYGLSLSIGGGEVTLLEITNAFATLARLGQFKPSTLQQKDTAKQRVANATQCQLIAEILTNNNARSHTFGTQSQLRFPFKCAVKTGTSTDYKDNFCMGFTAQYTVGVWVGNIDNTPMQGISGVTGAGPIFHQTMLLLHKNQAAQWFPTPQELSTHAVDPHTGKILKPGHPRYPIAEKMTLLKPPEEASSHDYDSNQRPYLDQRYSKWVDSHKQVFAKASSSHLDSPLETLRILSPAAEATYLLNPDLPNSGNKLTLLANHTAIEWSSDTISISGNKATLILGRHTITARHKQTGETKDVNIRVEQE